jgi:hypothetical protein
MKILNTCLIVILISAMTPLSICAQKLQNSLNQITSSDMESYVSFLASPLLKGRMNGEEGLEIAAQYIASQAKLLGLRPACNNSYFQPYYVKKKTIDLNKTRIQIISGTKDTMAIKEPFIQLVPMGPSDFMIEGEVVFAGYGIKADDYKYNDFENLRTEGKILLVMDRAPMSEDGKKCLFKEPNWNSEMNFQMKLTTLILSKAKAILFISDPKSGFLSFEESLPGIAGYLKSTITLNSEEPEITNPFMAGMPKVIFIHRSVANELLKGSGHSLEDLQNSIDATLQPHSFTIKDKQIKITEVSFKEEKVLNNIAGYIEGSDPVLKNEVVVFSGHYDHIGASGTKVNTGADDDASGCAALLSIAEAFQTMEKKPLRSVLFLWVSGEEIGLFGSKSYVDNPLFPLEKTVVDLNMDMIGRVKGVADSTDENPMTGPNTVFVITDNQSKELQSIADDIDKRSPLDFDYSLSGRGHPLQLFARSDHYNFVKKDIPVLFFTTGLHTDYHTPGDVIDKIDFKKMELVTRTMYEIGFTIANRKTRLIIDNPFSSWGKNK